MKKAILLAVATATLMTNLSCRNEKEGGTTKENSKSNAELIKGKWFLESERTKFGNTKKEDEFKVYVDDCSKKSNFEFQGGGVLVYQEFENKDGICSPSISAMDYKFDNNQLIVSNSKVRELKINITKITDKELIFSHKQNVDDDDILDEIIYTFHK